MAETDPRVCRAGEIIVDRDRAANLVREHHRMSAALYRLHTLVDEAREAADQVDRALAASPDYDAIPATVLKTEHDAEVMRLRTALADIKGYCDEQVATGNDGWQAVAVIANTVRQVLAQKEVGGER